METRDFKDPRHVAWRKKVFARDGYTCQFPGCGQKGGHLNAHHIKLWAAWPSLRFIVDNGITLCKSCHDRVFGREEDYELTFMQIVESINVNKKANQLTKKKNDIKVMDIWFKNL